MSHRSGDRARADKQRTKRRLRRSELRPLRKLSGPAVPVSANAPALDREDPPPQSK